MVKQKLKQIYSTTKDRLLAYGVFLIVAFRVAPRQLFVGIAMIIMLGATVVGAFT